MKPSNPFRVDFLIAGVQKAGTYSLYRLLGQHPEIGLSSRKEVHFFDDEVSVDWSKPDYDRYHMFFVDRRSKAVFGEATPIYIYWPNSLERIEAYNPGMKLISVFRDPISRAYSAWHHQRRKKREVLLFSEAIREGRARISSRPDFASRHFSYVERGFYAEQLGRALDLFPRTNILTIEGRELALNPRALIGRISHFLGVRVPSRHVQPVHVNRRAGVDVLDRPSAHDMELLVDIFASDLERFAKLVDFSIDHWPTSRLMRGFASAEEIAAELSVPGFVFPEGSGKHETISI